MKYVIVLPALLWITVLSRFEVHAAENSPPPPSSTILAEGEPLLRTWVAGEFPADVSPGVQKGSATVRIIVDANGAVTAARALTASAPAFGEAAIAAVKQWVFTPGVLDGERTAMCLDVPFQISRDQKPSSRLLPPRNLRPKLVPRTAAAVISSPLPDCPKPFRSSGIRGAILFACKVGPDAMPVGLQIARASHADLIPPVLAAIPSWSFQPATQGDLTIGGDLVGEVEYRDIITPSRDRVLALNGLTAPDGSAPAATPLPIAMVDPVVPYDRLLKGDAVSANVEFTVTANGRVRDAHVREASDPDFGAATVAALALWRFQPALVNGQGTEVRLMKRFEFSPASSDPNTERIARLVGLVREKAVLGGRGLDEKIAPFYRVAPLHPDGLAVGEKARAVIEFVIDRDGRARLPRVVSTTAAEHGWSAATAVSQWVFNPPKRGGQPSEVKVELPLEF